MIRRAVEGDLEAIVELGMEFAHKSKAVHAMAPSEEKIRNVARAAITDPEAETVTLPFAANV